MKKKIKFILVSLLTIILLLIFYFFFPHVWGEILYPLDYKDFIKKYSLEKNLHPNFVAAVIYSESRFNPKSTSAAGAQGLMQIMPGTAQSISQELGEPLGDLYDPETNIKYGTWYLRNLLDIYNEDKDLTLAAYNAGFNRANQYKDTGFVLPQETLFFIQKVKGAEEMYNKIYTDWYIKDVSKINPVALGFSNIAQFVKKLILGQ